MPGTVGFDVPAVAGDVVFISAFNEESSLHPEGYGHEVIALRPLAAPD